MEIKVKTIQETSYEDGTSWVSYLVDNKWGYEIVTGIEEGFDSEEEAIEHYQGMYEGKLRNLVVNKPHISTCSAYLAEIIEECLQSENEMWFVEREDVIEHFELYHLDEEMADRAIEGITDCVYNEVKKLGIEEYVTFGEEDCEIVVYGGVITKFLF